jgi:hypothetical protein
MKMDTIILKLFRDLELILLLKIILSIRILTVMRVTTNIVQGSLFIMQISPLRKVSRATSLKELEKARIPTE